MPSSFFLTFFVGFGVPIALAFFLKKLKIDSNLSIVRVISIYGYSWGVIVVCCFLCAMPWTIAQWIVVGITIPFNIWIIVLNYLLDKQINLKSKVIVISSISVVQTVLMLCYKLFFLRSIS